MGEALSAVTNYLLRNVSQCQVLMNPKWVCMMNQPYLRMGIKISLLRKKITQ